MDHDSCKELFKNIREHPGIFAAVQAKTDRKEGMRGSYPTEISRSARS
jgi:hypothetical protein